jgi:hypothetical protein
LGGRTTKNIFAVILQELIALERHWDFWSGSVCGAPSLASPRKALAFGFSPIQRRRRHGKSALLDIQNDNQ